MPFVVTQLTRMRDGHVCIAGIDSATGHHMRPVLQGGQRFMATVLARNGGPFEFGAVVELGQTQRRSQPPEVEDVVLLGQPTRTGEFTPQDFWALLDSTAQPTLSGIFGAALEKKGAHACGTSCGQGQASLGILRPKRPVRIDMREFKEGTKIKASVPFGTEIVSVPVTDVRLFEVDCITPSRTRFTRMSRLLQSGFPVLLAMGLARAWAANGCEAVHYLQLNGIFVNNGSLWRDCDDRA